MPELPEVQTVVEILNQELTDITIKNVEIFREKIIKLPQVNLFKSMLENQTIKKITRRGKYIIFHLSDFELVSHLRMEGRYDIFPISKYIKHKHDHVIFYTKNDMVIAYNDSRVFGTMHLVPKGTYTQLENIKKLGLEFDDVRLTENYLLNQLKKSSQAIKTKLLSQEIFTGLGNIYVDEMLWLAKINPFTPAKAITLQQAREIIVNSRIILNKAIKYKGSTIKTYSAGNNRIGNYQQFLVVYDKEGTNCPRCGTIIIYTKVNQRGTRICPLCQN